MSRKDGTVLALGTMGGLALIAAVVAFSTVNMTEQQVEDGTAAFTESVITGMLRVMEPIIVLAAFTTFLGIAIALLAAPVLWWRQRSS